MTIFREMLRIKQHRENKAELEVSRSRTALADAISAEERAKDALKQYKQYAIDQERAVYAELCTKVVRLRDIEDVQFVVSELRSGERQYEERCVQAAKAHEKAIEVLDGAKLAHKDASKMKEKFVELARSFDEERLKELQRLEDLEMEEVRLVSQDREEREEWERDHDEQ
ncbi:type III secretion system stalk subunit SctO [Parachitinimonas caeni]|uniref:YscO family type III secretion system apparatus protein n=1 Tax=Parachitinimonas caeni TaxID=3031301 RepID=A0ABT7DTV1_9NEIS|nr:YscO family type III secretion system apparatus protein [Parachitinimonas caeni]MDK2123498.1 YscO family type III secretion system apparatus protein [Parachitinimonas caeni]